MTSLDRYRVAIGPANFAGQATEWARVLREHGARARSFGPWPDKSSFGYDVDDKMRPGRFTGLITRPIEMSMVARNSSHVVVDGFLRAFIPGARGDLGRDLSLLERMGKKVAVLAHGADVRDPDHHMERFSDSYFQHSPEEYVKKFRKFTAKNRAVASGRVAFVSTPDLLLDLPHATWLPLTLDSTRWATGGAAFQRPKLRVLHMPSKRVPPIKGTEAIEPVLRSLQDEGVIEWVSPGRVEHDEVPALIKSVDVVVDQIMSGVYGVAAVESMSASRLVIGRMDPHVTACMPEAPPIVDADPHNLRGVLLDVVRRRDHYAEIAQCGPGYVDRNHSPAVVAERFASAWSGA